MVSKAREDFPEPLTPVTTVMALCGISTLMFLRLWTRAPRTRMDSCCGRISVVAWVISFVAKGKPRQRVSSALPKLQIIRPPSKRGKQRSACGKLRGRMRWRICAAKSRLLGEVDLSDSAFHFQVNGGRGFSISVVGVGVPVVLQAAHVDRTDAAGCMSDDADVFRETNVGLPHAASNVGRQVGFAVAGEVDIDLARADIEIQPGERKVAKMQIHLPGPHIHFQIQRDVLAEAQIPIVFGTAEVEGVGILRNVELSDPTGHAVLDARGFERAAVGEVRVKHVVRAAVDGEFSLAHFQPSVRRLYSLEIHGLSVVLCFPREAVAAGKTASVPEKDDQNNDKCKHSHGGADGNSRRRSGIAASVCGIPNLS